MRIGLFHSIQWPDGSDQSEPCEQALTQACHADVLGFDSVWLTEHHFSPHGIVSDSLMVLAHLAALFRGFGVDIAEKHERFDEALEVIRKVWSVDGSVSHSGRYFSFAGAAPQPRPYQQPHHRCGWPPTAPTDLPRAPRRTWGSCCRRARR
jgi:alkanesulfonate monooxygenase SsuD/methylene tetrahydromethanopterin reductase-like flavin-dependent oxidoreductase (luciferase family)